MTEVEYRCPVSPIRLFAKGNLAPGESGSTISVACDQCRAGIRKRGGRADRVIHVFRLDGSVLGTEVQTAEPPVIPRDLLRG
jgi:hypothetical protein